MRLNHFPKLAKQILAVVGPGGGFGVILDTKGRKFAVLQTSDRVVIQIDMSYLKAIR